MRQKISKTLGIHSIWILTMVWRPLCLNYGSPIFDLLCFSIFYTIFSIIIFVPFIPHMEKAMAPHSSTLAWKIPRTEEPGRLQSMGLLRVRHDWASSLSLFTFTHRRKWQPTPVFLPGESQGWGSLVGCCLWGRRVGHDWSDLAAAALCLKKK